MQMNAHSGLNTAKRQWSDYYYSDRRHYKKGDSKKTEFHVKLFCNENLCEMLCNCIIFKHMTYVCSLLILLIAHRSLIFNRNQKL